MNPKQEKYFWALMNPKQEKYFWLTQGKLGGYYSHHESTLATHKKLPFEATPIRKNKEEY